jgi:hypothetical protein
VQKAGVPAACRSLVLVLLTVREEERQLESLGEADELELRGG